MSGQAPADPAAPEQAPRRPRRRRPRLIWVVLVALVALAPPAHLAQTSGVLATGYTIQRLQGERTAWQVKNQQLELELAKARSLAWIETEAVHRLGMQRPSEQSMVAIDVTMPSNPTIPTSPGRAAARERPADERLAGAVAEVPASGRTVEIERDGSWFDRVGTMLAALILEP
jgi:hypothetical protein